MQARDYQYTNPVYIKKLVDAGMTHTDIADQFGRQATTIGKWLRDEKCPHDAELAAELIWIKKNGNKATSNGFAVVRGELDKVQTLRTVAEAMGLQFAAFQDK